MKKFLPILLAALLILSTPVTAQPSSWTEHESYPGKVAAKFGFGLKNSLFSWMQWWKQAHNPRFDHPWQGFCYGIGRSVTGTVGGLVHLATFPIPVDFPEMEGL